MNNNQNEYWRGLLANVKIQARKKDPRSIYSLLKSCNSLIFWEKNYLSQSRNNLV